MCCYGAFLALYLFLFVLIETVSDILEKRSKDSDTDGYKDWVIKSVHNWGENPRGKWKIEVKANVSMLRLHTHIVTTFTSV